MSPGYKRTEVGEIPEEWECTLLDRVAARASGHTPDKAHAEYWNGPIAWISLQDSNRLDKPLISETTATITEAGIRNSSARILPAGTVVLSRDAGVGRSTIMARAMAVSQHFMAWTCGPRLSNSFLYYWLQRTKPEFERIAMGNTIKTIGVPYFLHLQIPLPPRPQQDAIATALGDADSLIESLEHLLAKKRAIKQGAMQSLLTGAKRLPGFTAPWRTMPFGDLARPRRDRIDPSRTDSGSGTFCIELEHIQPATGRLLGASTAHAGAALKSVFRPGDVLFGKLRAYLRKYWLADRHGCCSTEVWVLAPVDEAVTSQFLYQLVTTDGFVEAASTAYGTHMPRSDWRLVSGLQISLPAPAEQSAIAEVLSDLDADLDATAAKLDKARAIKQGMMQELLTGRIRLV